MAGVDDWMPNDARRISDSIELLRIQAEAIARQPGGGFFGTDRTITADMLARRTPPRTIRERVSDAWRAFKDGF